MSMHDGTDSARSTLEHAWRYFEVHTRQRISAFNFFTIFAGFNSAGLGATFQQGERFAVLGALLGFLLTLLSLVFWKLDQRASFLIKHAETALADAERRSIEPAGRLFATEPSSAAVLRTGWLSGIWTFGRAFRLTFILAALIGLTGSTLSMLRFLDVISFESGMGQPRSETMPSAIARPHSNAVPSHSGGRQVLPGREESTAAR